MRHCWFSFKSESVGENFFSTRCIASGQTWYTSHPILIEPNQIYTVSNHIEGTGANPSFLFLDENFTIIDGFLNLHRRVVTFTVPNNKEIKYVVFPIYYTQMNYAQFEQGDNATPYQPYGQNTYLPQNVQ